MFTRIITAIAGQAATRSVGGVSGPASLIAGAAIPFIARRFGPLGMIGLAAGAFAAKRLAERRGRAPELPKPAALEPLRQSPLP